MLAARGVSYYRHGARLEKNPSSGEAELPKLCRHWIGRGCERIDDQLEPQTYTCKTKDHRSLWY